MVKPRSSSSLSGRSISPVKSFVKEQNSPENLSNRKSEDLSPDFSKQQHQKPETGKIQPVSPSKLFPSHSPSQNFLINPNFIDSKGKI